MDISTELYKLAKRIYMYEHYIQKPFLNKTIGHYFSRKNNHDVNIFVLNFSNQPPTDFFRIFREQLENKWQFRLHTNFPLCLNTADDTFLYIFRRYKTLFPWLQSGETIRCLMLYHSFSGPKQFQKATQNSHIKQLRHFNIHPTRYQPSLSGQEKL